MIKRGLHVIGGPFFVSGFFELATAINQFYACHLLGIDEVMVEFVIQLKAIIFGIFIINGVFEVGMTQVKQPIPFRNIELIPVLVIGFRMGTCS